MCSTKVSKCEVCNEENSKYKCPRCLIKYCSLGCYKSHKDESSTVRCEEKKAQPVKETPPAAEESESEEEREYEEQETEDRVPEHLLQALGESAALKDQLQNPHLRDILTNLDQAKNPGKAVEKLMREPLFEEFVDECLKVVEPEKEQETSSMDFDFE